MSDQSGAGGGPSAALAEMRRERDEARRRLAEVEGEVARLKPFETQATDLASQVADLSGELGTLKSTHAVDVKLARMGFDDAGALVAKALHAALGDGAPDLGDWVDSFTPETTPRPLKTYLEQPATTATAGGEGAAAGAGTEAAGAGGASGGGDAGAGDGEGTGAAKVPTPRPGAGADGSAPTGSTVTNEAIEARRAAFAKNPSAANRTALENIVKEARAISSAQ